jgi:Phosphopantetheine attachment site
MFGDMTCPVCGRHLWFIAGRSAAYFFSSAAELDHILVYLSEQGKWSELGVDSLDLVELMAELEER